MGNSCKDTSGSLGRDVSRLSAVDIVLSNFFCCSVNTLRYNPVVYDLAFDLKLDSIERYYFNYNNNNIIKVEQ